MKNSLLFIGCLYSEKEKRTFFTKSKRGYQFAAQLFQESILDGIISNGFKPYVVSVPSLSTFPFGSELPFIKTSPMIYSSNHYGTSVGYLNLPIANKLLPRLYRETLKWLDQAPQNSIVLVYGLHNTLLKAAVHLKKHRPDIKICSIVPDLPKFMSCNPIYRKLGLQKRDIKSINNCLPYIDSFVLLSKYMVNELNILNKPHIVVEGIYNDLKTTNFDNIEKCRAILYSGGLNFRYGIGDLVQAFTLYVNGDYELWLCGQGDAVPYITEKASQDRRIKYFGMLPSSDVRLFQHKACLLVNPRHSNEDFTYYSFPSKTMEYLASGTPTVMSHLHSIPQEYDSHLFYFDDESIEGIAAKINEILEMRNDVLIEKGHNAQMFILEDKNPHKQVERILSFLGVE